MGKVRLYSYLIPPEKEAPADAAPEEEEHEELDGADETDAEAKMKAFLAQVDPNSLKELANAKLECSMSDAKPYDRFQFERNGFFVVDKYSTTGGPLVFNRTIGLKASGDKKQEVDDIPRSRKEEQDKQRAEKEAKKSIDPRDMFRSQTDLYSQFDENGIPTHDHSGEPINKTRFKKLKQEWEKQKKLFGS